MPWCETSHVRYPGQPSRQAVSRTRQRQQAERQHRDRDLPCRSAARRHGMPAQAPHQLGRPERVRSDRPTPRRNRRTRRRRVRRRRSAAGEWPPAREPVGQCNERIACAFSAPVQLRQRKRRNALRSAGCGCRQWHGGSAALRASIARSHSLSAPIERLFMLAEPMRRRRSSITMTLEWIMVAVPSSPSSTCGYIRRTRSPPALRSVRQKRMRPLRIVFDSTQDSCWRGATISTSSFLRSRRRLASRRAIRLRGHDTDFRCRSCAPRRRWNRGRALRTPSPRRGRDSGAVCARYRSPRR